MSSSPIQALSRYLPDTNPINNQPTTPSLREVFETIPDPRKRRGIRHQLADILLICASAVMSGARSFTAIRDWADIHREVLADTGAKPPSKHTVRRVLLLLDADQLDQLLGAWALSRTMSQTGQDPLAVAVDGKEVRGAKNGGGQRVHLLSACTHEQPTVIGQVSVGVKTNEIPEVETLFTQIGPAVKGKVFTFDALHCQQSTARLIHQAGAYYVFTVKANQPRLLQRVADLPWGQVSAGSRISKGHGRKVRRTHRVLYAPEWIDFPHAVQVAKVRRTRTVKGKTTWEEVYVITNHPVATFEQIAAWTQGHWFIENQVHYLRDTLWDEDRSQIRTGSAPRVMATLRNTALSLLRLANATEITRTTRYLWANPQVATALTGL